MNVQYKRCGLPKTRQRHPSLPFDSLPYPPVQSVDTCAWSVMRQPNKKRSIIFYVYEALSHARGTRVGAPLEASLIKVQSWLSSVEAHWVPR